jgi:hypothetical protein
MKMGKKEKTGKTDGRTKGSGEGGERSDAQKWRAVRMDRRHRMVTREQAGNKRDGRTEGQKVKVGRSEEPENGMVEIRKEKAQK